MKESEFIELLNLYVDHEISTPDAARLEAEVAANAARRKTYREYCMMHKACDALAAHYRDPSHQTPTFIVERERPGVWGWGAGVVTGGLMAAAGLAVVFVVHVRHAGPAAGAVAASAQPTPAVASAELANFHRAVPARFSGGGELQPVLNMRDWNHSSPVQNESLAWMNQVELAPVQRTALDQLPNFETAPLLLTTGSAATEVTAPAQEQASERVAFQFQR